MLVAAAAAVLLLLLLLLLPVVLAVLLAGDVNFSRCFVHISACAFFDASALSWLALPVTPSLLSNQRKDDVLVQQLVVMISSALVLAFSVERDVHVLKHSGSFDRLGGAPK